MEISPRYDGPPAIQLAGDPAAIAEPFLRQRKRVGSVLAGLTDLQWRTQSRCAEWTVQDVAIHLVSTNQFWSFSVGAGADGEPTRFLAGFDPKSSPAALVDAARGTAPSATLATFVETNRALCDLVEGLDAGAFAALGEAPPGHVTIGAVLHHALWDSWIHERDLLVPLRIEQEIHDDEVVACLRYAAAIGPALAAAAGADRHGALVIEATDPTARIVASIDGEVVRVDDGPAPAPEDAFVLRGDAVALVDALTIRAPLPCGIPAEHAWLLAGLAEVFETTAV